VLWPPPHLYSTGAGPTNHGGHPRLGREVEYDWAFGPSQGGDRLTNHMRVNLFTGLVELNSKVESSRGKKFWLGLTDEAGRLELALQPLCGGHEHPATEERRENSIKSTSCD
jgi:hypothetical protein